MAESPQVRLERARAALTAPETVVGSADDGDGDAAGDAASLDADPDAESVARSIALRRLAGSPQSRRQLADAMRRKDVPEPVANRVLDRFEEVGLVDDVEYAHMLVRTRQSERGLARRALAVELRRKGIDPETANQALDGVDTDSETDAARRLVEKRLRSMSGLDRHVKRRRLAGMLARKGHPAGLSFRVIDAALGRENGDNGDTGAVED